MASKSKVYFFFDNVDVPLRERARLKAYIVNMARKEGKKLDGLNYIFCSDERLLEINKQYLKHDYYTDIITFELSQGPAIAGEIYISIDRVRDNAKIEGTTVKAELHRVIFHGLLHLCGYRDKKPREKTIMREKEDYYLEKYL